MKIKLWVTGIMVMGAAAMAAQQPNVLLIISDDQGIGDFGFFGNKTVKTPTLDKLFESSAYFKTCIVGAACSPSRASIMTGRNHMKTGVWGVGIKNNLLADEVIMPAYFKANGYATGYFGKMDGVFTSEWQSWDRGCDEASYPIGPTSYTHKDAIRLTQKGNVQTTGWTCDVDVDVDLTLDFIKRQGDKKWWCTTAFILPHMPWIADEEFVTPYLKAGCSENLSKAYGCISQMDAAVSRLLKGLEELGQVGNTIVVFLSDNGPTYNKNTEAEIKIRNSLGLRGQKAEAWDNGIRVPMLIHWQGKIAPGERFQLSSAEDILPTLVDLAGLNPGAFPSHLPFDGMSLRPVLEDPNAPESERLIMRPSVRFIGGPSAVINDPAQLKIDNKFQHYVLRGPRFKLHSLKDGTVELYDIKDDPGETKNVISEYPEVAARYQAELNKQYEELTQGGRAYRTPQIKIARVPGRGNNRMRSGSAIRTFGEFQQYFQNYYYLRGFLKAGDSAEYKIEVLDPGMYQLRIEGSHFANNPSWRIEMNGTSYEPCTLTDELLVFDPMPFSRSGSQSFSLSVESAGAGERPIPTWMIFKNMSGK